VSVETTTALGLVAAAALAQVVAAPVDEPLSQIAFYLVAVAVGAVGGVIATLKGNDPITQRGLAAKVITSALLGPTIVFLYCKFNVISPTLVETIIYAGPAALLAWPISERADIVVDRLMVWLGGARKGRDGGN